MPGIAGLITKKPREEAERELRRMVESMRHEKYYATGTWIDESLGVYVGWTARVGSFSDRMPLRNERGDIVLTFSGEEFPGAETLSDLRAKGHEFAVSGASYLPHVYEDDPAFPISLNGRFHGLLADRSRGEATLFNDRYGMHRVYYHEFPDAFYFAAEAKAILEVRPELRQMDPRGVGEFVGCGCAMEGRTVFSGIRVMPGGSKWMFRKGGMQKDRYFKPEDWENQSRLEPEQFYEELREVYSKNLPRYFGGNERIAMSLTGGLDTRMIMAWQKSAPGTFPCYTFGGMFRDCYDVTLSRRVASMCGQRHQVIPTGLEFLNQFDHYARRAVYLTDGCVDVSRAPDVYINEIAREIAPVRMTGNYGGEVLRRVRTFKPEGRAPGLFQPEFVAYIDQTSETYRENLKGNAVTFALFKQIPWNHYGTLAIEESRLSLRSPFLDTDLVRTVFRAPNASLDSDEVSFRLIGDGHKELLQIPTDRGLLGGRGRLAGAAHHKFLEFLFKAEYAYDMGMPQWVAKIDHQFSAFHLERLFLGRHKVFHFRVWYRDALANYVREVLLDSRSLSRPYLERKGVEKMLLGHLKGNRNNTNDIHKVLTLELLHQIFLDGTSTMNSAELPDTTIAST